jgi:large subunit ribosomal protein L25
MSMSFDLIGESRSDKGKGASRRLRRAGRVPAIVYGGKKAPVMVTLPHTQLSLQMENPAFYSHILNLRVGADSEQVVLKDVQRHPSKPYIQHIDLLRIRADEKIRMTVAVVFLNEETAKGVKMGGAVLGHITEVEIDCLPGDLPEFIGVDLANLNIGETVHLSEIALPAGVELAHLPDPDLPVVSIEEIRGGEGEAEGGKED